MAFFGVYSGEKGHCSFPMSGTFNKALKLALSALHYSGVGNALAPLVGRRGVIFMLHQVDTTPPEAFSPKYILKVTPSFLDNVINEVLDSGFQVISLDDVPAHLAKGKDAPPFACFTFDDGYRDNRDHALPLFRKYNLPFTVYVPSRYPDQTAELWWLALEEVIRQSPVLSVQMDGALRRFVAKTAPEKTATFNTIYWWLRSIPEDRARAVVRELAQSIGYDVTQPAKELLMDWQELREFASDPLVTIGAHTRNHYELAKLPYELAYEEMAGGISELEEKLGRKIRHFSFPYGCENSATEREFEMAKSLGLTTAVTTRKGLITDAHKAALTGLPRLSLNGDFQDCRYVRALLTGVPFALWGAVARVSKSRNKPPVFEAKLMSDSGVQR